VLSNGAGQNQTAGALQGILFNKNWSISNVKSRSKVIYSRVIASKDVVFLIGMAKTMDGWTLHATALSASDGSVLATRNVPSKLQQGTKDAFFAISNSTADSHIVAWVEDGQLRFVPLKSELDIKGTYNIQGTSYKRILDVGLDKNAHIMALTEDGSGHVFKLDGEALRPIWQYVQSVCGFLITQNCASIDLFM
jgi:ER membrane protein complex subunit 1